MSRTIAALVTLVAAATWPASSTGAATRQFNEATPAGLIGWATRAAAPPVTAAGSVAPIPYVYPVEPSASVKATGTAGAGARLTAP